MSAVLEVKNLHKSFHGTAINTDIDFEVEAGEFFFLLGPSGCGKSTLLKMLSGLLAPDCGEIRLNGQNITSLPPEKRAINTIFQNYALFPHLNVYDNIAFGLKMKKVAKDQLQRRVAEALALVQLEGFEKRKPQEMSGGQKQRVAIARAIVNEPAVLLLDEPLSALDVKLRKTMQYELRQLQKRLNTTFVYVTHNQEEALTMGDKVAVMNRGRIEQIGSPQNIYNQPQTRFVAQFIGEINLIEYKYLTVKGGQTEAQLPGGAMVLAGYRAGSGQSSLAVRPEHIVMAARSEPGGRFENRLSGTIVEESFTGDITRYTVEIDSANRLTVSRQNNFMAESYQPGQQVQLYWRKENTIVIDE